MQLIVWATDTDVYILQHDYENLSKNLLKHRRLSHSTPEASNRATRRKSAIESGVSKFSDSAAKKRRRSTLGGMIGDRVFIPGSPAMTLPELLMQAEVGLEQKGSISTHETPMKALSFHRDPFKTPGPRGNPISFEACDDNGTTRQWVKEDWKQLDACFTDERLDAAVKLGLGEDAIGDVDEVRIEDVVERFVNTMGGAQVVEGWGSLWDR